MSAEPSTLRESIERLRAIPAKWKHLADPLGDLKRLREDPYFNPWDDPKWAVPFQKCCENCNCEVPTNPNYAST